MSAAPAKGTPPVAPADARVRGLPVGAVALAFFVLFGVAWSWPLALSPASTTLSLHFDQFPAAWLVHAAPSFLDGVSELSAYPDGEPLVRLDSFLLLFLAFVLNGAVSGLLVTNLFVLLGPPLSAWTAERFAREVLDAPFPASLAAGLAFGFAPLATVAVLEGHVYYLLDPWLPLVGLYAWRGQAWRAVGAWALCLLSTAYLGVDGLLVLGAAMAARRRLDLRMVAGVGAVGALYAVLFAYGTATTGLTAGGIASEALMRIGAAGLTTLVAWNPWMDLNRHSLAPALGLVPLCLGLLAPWAGLRGWRVWLLLGVGCAIASVGPALEVGVIRAEAIPTPLWPLFLLGAFSTYRFPIRLAWVTALTLGGLAAAVGGRTRWPWAVVALAGVDALVFSGAALRLRSHPTPVPAVYGLLPDAPVLDLYPEVGGPQEDVSFYQQNLSCYYQTFHERPIFDRCLNTDIRSSPRVAAAREVHARLLDGQPVAGWLAERGVGAVVVHADLYQGFERAAVLGGLGRELGPPAGEGHDGGEWLVAWAVPRATGAP